MIRWMTAILFFINNYLSLSILHDHCDICRQHESKSFHFSDLGQLIMMFLDIIIIIKEIKAEIHFWSTQNGEIYIDFNVCLICAIIPIKIGKKPIEIQIIHSSKLVFIYSNSINRRLDNLKLCMILNKIKTDII